MSNDKRRRQAVIKEENKQQ